MQAIILAAGMGRRLKELTRDNTKCMIEVNGETLIERILTQLDGLNLERIVLVIGYKGEKLAAYVKSLPIKTEIIFITNPIYDKTNNIYSLYLAKEYLLEQDTLLLESDLIIEDGILDILIQNPDPNIVLVAKYESWMDGTVVTLDESQQIKSFLGKKDFHFCDTMTYYKTVNIYKFSRAFSMTHYVPFLEAYCKALGNNEYYEQVLKVIALLDNPGIKALVLNTEKWYEIDDIQDLDIAQTLFEKNKSTRFEKMNARYGGFWRFPRLLDFCYLVNPYYPPAKLIDEMQASFNSLITQYPSGQKVNNLLAANYYGLHRENVIVGNGAAELIKAIMEDAEGIIGILSPSFDEYRNRVSGNRISLFTVQSDDFSYTADQIISHFQNRPISTLLLINPDNPSGNYIEQHDVLKLASWAQERGILFLVDESFSDFALTKEPSSLLEQSTLERYTNLVVIKSISKSFGVPGARLGLLATTNKTILSDVSKNVSIWNINSFGEFYMQIWGKYRATYEHALVMLKYERDRLATELKQIDYLTVFPSQANYIMCEVKAPKKAYDLAVDLLDAHNILIKDLSSKRGISPRQCIRIAVRNKEDNDALINALRSLV